MGSWNSLLFPRHLIVRCWTGVAYSHHNSTYLKVASDVLGYYNYLVELFSVVTHHNNSTVQYPLFLLSADVNEERDWVLMSASFDPRWRVQNALCIILRLHKRHRHKSGIVCLYGSSSCVFCSQTFQSDTLNE